MTSMTDQRPVKTPPRAEPPHLESPVGTMWNTTHPDLTAETITVDVLVQREQGHQAHIYVEERGEQILLRLRPDEARYLADLLLAGVDAAEIQDSIDLPDLDEAAK